MSSVAGPRRAGNRSRSAATISAVSSTESVVCVTYATRSGSGTLERARPPRPTRRARSRPAPRPSSRRPPRGRRGRRGRRCSPRPRTAAPRRAPSSRAGTSRRSCGARARAAFAWTDGRDAVRGEHEHRARAAPPPRSSTKTAPRCLELADDVALWTICLPDVDRRAVELDRPLDRLDRPLHARAVPARRGEEDAFHHAAADDSRGPSRAPERPARREKRESPPLGGVGAAGLLDRSPRLGQVPRRGSHRPVPRTLSAARDPAIGRTAHL